MDIVVLCGCCSSNILIIILSQLAKYSHDNTGISVVHLLIFLTGDTELPAFSPGNLGQAELIGREALRLLPNDHTIMFSLANVLGKQEKYKVSIIFIAGKKKKEILSLGYKAKPL